MQRAAGLVRAAAAAVHRRADVTTSCRTAAAITAVHHGAATTTATASRCFTRPFSSTSSAAAAPSSSSDSTLAPSAAATTGLASLPADLSSLASGVLGGDRLSLSRAITLIESSHPRHVVQAQQLLAALAYERNNRAAAKDKEEKADESATPTIVADANGRMSKEQREELDAIMQRKKRALRIGISGPPGVGKSTFIEALGRYLLSLGHRLAVLSIDPSSHVTGGSILGDKTRMLELSRTPGAFVRPSPSKCVLGGVGSNTFDTILLCEHAGFDLVFVETVGVGQSEVSVGDMVDLVVLLVQPGGGDELQGMKKGIVELIDLVVVNKADGALLANARHTKLEYMHALQLNTRRKRDTDWKPTVKLCSSANESLGTSSGSATAHPQAAPESAPQPGAPTPEQKQRAQLSDIWSSMCAFHEWARGPHGDFLARRAKQSRALLLQAMNDNVYQRLLHALPSLPAFRAVQQRLATQAETQRIRAERDGTHHSPTAAAPDVAEVIPRVAAQTIVDEFIAREAQQQPPRS